MLFTSGILASPVAGTVLADSGPMPYNHILTSVSVILAGQAALIAELQIRNAANSANTFSQVLIVQALSSDVFTIPVPVALLINTRIRVVVFTTATGQSQATLAITDYDPGV